MVFRKRRKENKEPIKITLRNKIILSKESTQFLGMTLDNRLNCDVHINKLRAKAKGAFNTIKVVAGKKWGRDRKTLKNCTVQYVGYITQLLQEAYGSVPKKTKTKIYGKIGDELDTATPMVGKQNNILLWRSKTHSE